MDVNLVLVSSLCRPLPRSSLHLPTHLAFHYPNPFASLYPPCCQSFISKGNHPDKDVVPYLHLVGLLLAAVWNFEEMKVLGGKPYFITRCQLYSIRLRGQSVQTFQDVCTDSIWPHSSVPLPLNTLHFLPVVSVSVTHSNHIPFCVMSGLIREDRHVL